jgi:hypothetical protein
MTEIKIYRTLNPCTQSIRLIEIQPGSKQVTCKLHPFDLSNPPAYIALSYTWGPPFPTAEILIDDQPFIIREDLSLALRAIRRLVDEYNCKSEDAGGFRYEEGTNPSTWKYFWIDAISINQNDVLERNHQVNLMSKIFSQASLVISWLGEDGEDSRLAREFFDNSKGLSLAEKNALWEQPNQTSRNAVLAFFTREYWSRYVHGVQWRLASGQTVVG